MAATASPASRFASDRPKFEIGLAQPVLQFDGALRIGQPVFRDLAERLDDFAEFLGDLVGDAALFARLEIGRERAAAFFDEPRQIAREPLDIDGAEFGAGIWARRGVG